jgi:hypothetical protein
MATYSNWWTRKENAPASNEKPGTPGAQSHRNPKYLIGRHFRHAVTYLPPPIYACRVPRCSQVVTRSKISAAPTAGIIGMPLKSNVRLVHRRELSVPRRQRLVDPRANRMQRAALRHEVLKGDRAEQRFGVVVGSAHRSSSTYLSSMPSSPTRRGVSMRISTAC